MRLLSLHLNGYLPKKPNKLYFSDNEENELSKSLFQ